MSGQIGGQAVTLYPVYHDEDEAVADLLGNRQGDSRGAPARRDDPTPTVPVDIGSEDHITVLALETVTEVAALQEQLTTDLLGSGHGKEGGLNVGLDAGLGCAGC